MRDKIVNKLRSILPDDLSEIEQGSAECDLYEDLSTFNDLGWGGERMLSALLDKIGTDFQHSAISIDLVDQYYHPESKVAKEIRRVAIDIGWYEEDKSDFSIGKSYSFKLDGNPYRFVRNEKNIRISIHHGRK